MTIIDFIRSKANRELLEKFALEKLKSKWPQLQHILQDVVRSTIDSHLEDLTLYNTWAISSENIAEVNVAIWKQARSEIERHMLSVREDPSTALELRFDGNQRIVEARSDSINPDRHLESMREVYLNSWQ
jgi:hypothetical protein